MNDLGQESSCFLEKFESGRQISLGKDPNSGRSAARLALFHHPQGEGSDQQYPWTAVHQQVKPVNAKVHFLFCSNPFDFLPDMRLREKWSQSQRQGGHCEKWKPLDQ